MNRPATFGELKASGYAPRGVKEELRENLRRALAAGQNPFPGIHGYERTVLPSLHNAILSKHDLLLLGLRETAAMGTLLVTHLASVMALFLTLPFGKFVHAIYRFAALTRFHLERKRPLPEIGSE